MKCQLSWFPKYFALPELQLRMEKHKFNNRDIPQRDSVQFLEKSWLTNLPKNIIKDQFQVYFSRDALRIQVCFDIFA